MKSITPSELIDAFLTGETNVRTWTKHGLALFAL